MSISHESTLTYDVNWAPGSLIMSSGMLKYLNTWLSISSAVLKADGRLGRGIRCRDLENRLAITMMLVLHCNRRRSVMKPMALFQSWFYSKELPVGNVIVVLSREQLPWQEGHWVDLELFSKPLWENGPETCFWGIYLHDEWFGGVGDCPVHDCHNLVLVHEHSIWPNDVCQEGHIMHMKLTFSPLT